MTDKFRPVINYCLEEKRGITQLEAWDMFKASRLSDIMFRAKNKGYDVTSVWESNGESRWKRYFIKEVA